MYNKHPKGAVKLLGRALQLRLVHGYRACRLRTSGRVQSLHTGPRRFGGFALHIHSRIRILTLPDHRAFNSDSY